MLEGKMMRDLLAGCTRCLLLLCLVAPAALGRDVHVAISGSNSYDGSATRPYRTIKYAISQAVSGDRVLVHAGTYAESWIYVKGGTELISADGLWAAKIYSGNYSAIRLEADNAGIDGFEIYGNWNQGSAGDGLVRPVFSNNVWVKNCLVHDAPYDCDVIKIGANNVLIENCIVYNPAIRTSGTSYQECIDIYGTPDPDGVTVRGCWVFHTPERGGDDLIFAKGGARNIIWENNVFGPTQTDQNGGAAVQCGASSPSVFPSCENFIARNNLFLNLTGDGAFAFNSARNAHVYNNVFYNYLGGRCVIQFYMAGLKVPNEDCYVYNNIFLKTNGYPIYQDRGRWDPTISYIPTNFQHNNNLYWQINGGGDVNINTETGSIWADPMLVAPAAPDIVNDSWRSIVERFLLQDGSPAINAAAALTDVPADIFGVVRPVGAGPDIGVHEYVLPGDTQPDGAVDVVDLLVLVDAFGTADGDPLWDATADFNSDGVVDVVDLLILVDYFGRQL
jgi:hypothetical protein